MDNLAAARLVRAAITSNRGGFSWPLDGDYPQHLRFVTYRNRHWTGGTADDWSAFLLRFAVALETVLSPPRAYSEDGSWQAWLNIEADKAAGGTS